MVIVKMHTVSWERICQPRERGGLGNPKLTVSNQVLLTKLVWRLVMCSEDLSHRILNIKYGGWSALQRKENETTSSHIWRAVRSAFPLIRDGIRWNLGNGKQILFWLDRWVEDHPLLTLCSQ